jgi:predicted nucleotidyltransferase
MFDTSTWDRVLQERHAERERLRQSTLAEAVETLRRYFCTKQVKAVYLTGSILVEGKFLSRSDIDVAVEGLPEEEYLLTLAELGYLLQRDVDVIELEKCCFRDHILQKGLRVL